MVILPGEKIIDKPSRMKSTFVENGKTYASVVGIYSETSKKFVPLKSIYLPSPGDGVIGVITEERMHGYVVDIFSPYKGLILSKFLRTSFSPLDKVYAEVREVSEVKDIILSRPRKLEEGRIIFVHPSKIPRLIGKESSMINLIRNLTKCEITVGTNGAVWLKGKEIKKAIDAIFKVEKEAHIPGLTDRIKGFLESGE